MDSVNYNEVDEFKLDRLESSALSLYSGKTRKGTDTGLGVVKDGDDEKEEVRRLPRQMSVHCQKVRYGVRCDGCAHF